MIKPLKKNCHTEIHTWCLCLPFSGCLSHCLFRLHEKAELFSTYSPKESAHLQNKSVHRTFMQFQFVDAHKYAIYCKQLHQVFAIPYHWFSLHITYYYYVDIHLTIAFGKHPMICIFKLKDAHIIYNVHTNNDICATYEDRIIVCDVCEPMLRTHKLGVVWTYHKHCSPQLRGSLCKRQIQFWPQGYLFTSPNPTSQSNIASNGTIYHLKHVFPKKSINICGDFQPCFRYV